MNANDKGSSNAPQNTAYSDGTKVANNSETTKGFINFEGADAEQIEGLENLSLPEWFNDLELNKGGKVLSTLPNMQIILRHILNEGGCEIYHDVFALKIMVKGKLPWGEETDLREWVEADTDLFLAHIQKEPFYMVAVNKGTVWAALFDFANIKRRHPVKEYLESLPEWDGKPRLELLFADYLGAYCTDLSMEAPKIALVAAVKRIYEPGCELDYVVTLQGVQGCGKSKIWKRLVKDPAWCKDSALEMNNKDGYSQMNGAVFYELSDLAGLDKVSDAKLKNFISSTTDTYRVAYEKAATDHKRKGILIGTTNEDAHLKSAGGNRRWLIVRVMEQPRKFATTEAMLEAVEQIRDLLWAEALHLYRSGYKLILPEEAEREAETLQRESNEMQDDPMKTLIEWYLAMPEPIGFKKAPQEYRQNVYKRFMNKNYEPVEYDSYERRIYVIFEEFADDLALCCPDLKRNDPQQKKRFNKIMRLLPNWKQSNPTSYQPFAGKNTKVWMYEGRDYWIKPLSGMDKETPDKAKEADDLFNI